jgi:hypothetical protein
LECSPSHRLSNYRLRLIGVAVILVTIAAAGLAILDLRQYAINTYQQEMKNLGVAFAEQTARNLQSVDLVLDQVRERVLGSGVTTPEQFERLLASEELHQFLAERLKNLPQADLLSLIGADGKLVNYSRQWPVPAVDLSGRDYVHALRTHTDSTSLFSGPAKSRSTGAWQVYMVRRITGAHGELIGAILAAIRTDYLEAFYKAITLQASGSAMVLARDGTILARHPHTENMIGKKMPAEAPWYGLVAAGGGLYRSPGYVDGIARVVSVHPLQNYPIVVDVTIAEDAALAHWRRQSMFIGLGAFCAVLGFAVLFRALDVQFRQLEENRANLEAKTLDLQQTADALRESEGSPQRKIAAARNDPRTYGRGDTYDRWRTPGPDLQPAGHRDHGFPIRANGVVSLL